MDCCGKQELLSETRKTQGRNDAVDLLKILCMIYVVIIHIDIYSLDSSALAVRSFPYWFVNASSTLSMVAVNCFVLISGYYMSQSRIKPRKLVSLWIQVETYSVGLYLASCLLGLNGGFSLKMLIRFACPLLTSQYWFFTIYFLLMLVSPLLNVLVKNLTKEQYQKALLLLFIVFSVLPTINIFGDQFGTRNGFSLVWFMVLYLIAGYIRKYGIRKYRYGMAYLGICGMTLLIKAVCDLLSDRFPLCNIVVDLLYIYNSVFMLAASVCLFAFFLNVNLQLRPAAQKVIGAVSGVSFGIYLWHEHPDVKGWLWSRYVDLSDYVGKPVEFALRAVAALVLIVLVGLAIEFIRKPVQLCGENIIMKVAGKNKKEKL